MANSYKTKHKSDNYRTAMSSFFVSQLRFIRSGALVQNISENYFLPAVRYCLFSTCSPWKTLRCREFFPIDGAGLSQIFDLFFLNPFTKSKPFLS